MDEIINTCIYFSQTTFCIIVISVLTFLPIGFFIVVFVQLKLIHGVKRVNRYGLTVHLGDSCVIQLPMGSNTVSVNSFTVLANTLCVNICGKQKHLVVMLLQTVVILWLTKL